MRRLVFAWILLGACARSAPSSSVAPDPAWTLDDSTLDRTADPCTDFYQYVCGGFATPDHIAPDRGEAEWAFDHASVSNDRTVRDILAGQGGTGELARLRTFYGACMASDRDRTAPATLRGWLSRIDAITSRDGVLDTLRALHRAGIHAMFRYSGEADPVRRTAHRGEIDRGGLGWSRIYRDTEDGATRRAAYLDHIARMLKLAGARDPAHDADIVMSIDRALAAAIPPESDDVNATEHPMTAEALARLAPHLAWPAYLAMVGARPGAQINVVAPAYLAAVDHALAERPVPELAAYLRWQLVRGLGPALPGGLADEHYRYEALDDVARGSREVECGLETMRVLGVELSREFSARSLGAGRDPARDVAEHVRDEIVRGLAAERWLSPAARAATAEKLRTLLLKIGFPDQWPEVGSYPLAADTYLDNLLAAKTFEQQRSWQRVHRPRTREAWENIVFPNAGAGMAAARLSIPNGFPDVFSNAIVFTAAMVVPPLFDPRSPLEVRYGRFGSVVGHELVHIIETHEFNALGELRDTWSPGDIAAHDAQRACVVSQAARTVAYDDVHLDGKQTYGENVADLSGVRYAYAALARAAGPSLSSRGADGLTVAQRFFVSYAQYYCRAERPSFTRTNLLADPHAPSRYRVNGPLSNLPAFAAAFSCRAGAPMSAADRCTVW